MDHYFDCLFYMIRSGNLCCLIYLIVVKCIYLEMVRINNINSRQVIFILILIGRLFMRVAIDVINLVKKYGNNTVIHGISFSAIQGEIFALLGANGAGKTSTLECIEGIRSYSEGTISVHGRIGVQLQSSSLPGNISSIEAFRLFSRWNRKKDNEGLLERFGVVEFKNKQYRSLSTGQKRRLHLAIALINDPDIIFLDEPTAGLDVEGRVSLHTEIRKLKSSGKTIIMASHDMAEVESLCDKIVILREGRIAFQGASRDLTDTYMGECKILIRTINPIPIKEFNNSRLCGMEQGYFSVMATDIGDALLELLTYIRETDNEVIDLKVERATLEQRFIEIAREGK